MDELTKAELEDNTAYFEKDGTPTLSLCNHRIKRWKNDPRVSQPQLQFFIDWKKRHEAKL